MRRIAVINQKGGVGKTTTTVNLAGALAQAGRNVLLIDLDPQGHLTIHFGLEPSDDQPGAHQVLLGETPLDRALVKVSDRIDVLPADTDLAGIELELASVVGREVILREAVAKLAKKYDILLIDCPPSLGVLTINALTTCQEVLIPLQAQFFALQGLARLLDTLLLVRQRINTALTVAGIALCMHDPSTRLTAEIVEDINGFLQGSRESASPWANAQLFKTRIRRNVKLAEASSFGKTIFDYAPRSHGAEDYARLAAEIFGELIAPPKKVNEASETKVVKVAQKSVKKIVPTPAPPIAPPQKTAPSIEPNPTVQNHRKNKRREDQVASSPSAS